ncbi:hypothetical protein HYZ97_02350, partial [Candidatus Pacearchaeota archaeon]|nr:hypothetical protein [Candidatus Pacearchaeota archaeon]
MKFNFKKIASVLAGTVLMSSTLAFAAAANYPAPFVQGGNSDVYVVYGSAPGAEFDLVAVADITTNLQASLAKQTASSGSSSVSTSATGENYGLFTSSSELFLNSSLNSVIKTLTPTELPTILADETFDGDVTATYEQRIIVGEYPEISFQQQPTDNDDPQYGLFLGTTVSSQYAYNATVTFDQAVNFTHADSKGQEITLFGQKFTIGSATTNTKLVLFKSSEKVFLDSESNPAETVTVSGSEYTIQLVAATDTSATIKVTDSAGKSEQKEINEAASKKVNGIEVGINSADESTALNKLTAEVVVGADRVTLQDGNAMKIGSDETTVDGTQVEFEDQSGSATTSTHNITKLIFQATAEDSDVDAIVPGQSFVDPIFGSFKLDFTGISIPRDSSARETISVQSSGNDKASITFTNHEGNEATINWAYNKTDSPTGRIAVADGDGDLIVLAENQPINKSFYTILANDDRGGLYEVTQVGNSSSSTASDDELTIKNVFSGASYSAKASSEGSGTMTVEGLSFSYTYIGAQTLTDKARQVTFNFPESTGENKIYFPAIKTSKGAKIAFYQPTLINLTREFGAVAGTESIDLPDGDGYETITVAASTVDGDGNFTFDAGGSVHLNGTGTLAGDGKSSATATVGRLTYNFTNANQSGVPNNARYPNGQAQGGPNVTALFLISPEGGNIVRPAVIIFEEKDDLSNYEALIVTLDAGYDGDSAGLGVTDVVRTNSADGNGANGGNEIQLESDSDLYEDVSLFGSLITLDKSDSDQTTAKISYPDEQVEAFVYVAATDAVISTSGGGSGTVKELGSVLVKDSEVASLPSRNLIVVGG